MTIPLTYFTPWLASGERGISSEAIVSQVTGQPVGRPSRFSDHPSDPDDFRRCQRLMDAYPLARVAFYSEMPKRSKVWAALVEQWDDIDAAIREEVPGYMSGERGSAKKGYALMKELIYGPNQ